MNQKGLAPCGVICEVCLAFQRTANPCSGCGSDGPKPYHCTICSIKRCDEKQGDAMLPCSECVKFPCRRIRGLSKRYTMKYGEDILANFTAREKLGDKAFLTMELARWKCATCASLLCVHRENCLSCGASNPHFPDGGEPHPLVH